MNTPKKTKHPGIGILIGVFLFGAVFFLAGAFVTVFMAIKPLTLLDRTRAWVETPAQILDLELKRHPGRKGGPTYSIEMRYQYEFNGQTHTSERFTAFDRSDNVSSYHHTHYRHYKPLFDSKKPITCWVNPANPTEATVDRSLRFELLAFAHLFVFTFPLVGLLVMLCVLSLRDTDPDVRPIPLKTTPLYLCAIPAALTLAYTAFLFSKLIHFTPWPWYIGLLFLPALILSLVCINRYVYGKIFNGACFDMTHHAVLGDTLTGTILIPGPTEHQLPVTLRCQYRGHKTNITRWKTETPVTTVCYGTSANLPIRIGIPPDQPASTSPDANPSITWQLRVKVKRFGLRHTLTFDVPVKKKTTHEHP